MDFFEAVEKWEKVIDAYYISGGFYNKSYLQKFPRETDEKFRDRKSIATLEVGIAKDVNRYIGYLFKKLPTRETGGSEIALEIMLDADRRGNSIDVFMQNFAVNAKLRGVGLVLVDMPIDIPSNYKNQIEQRALPFFQFIPPEKIIEYELNEKGGFKRIKWEEEYEPVGGIYTSPQTIWKEFDEMGWRIYQPETDKPIKEGTHGLGECPVLIFSEDGGFPTIGEFTEIGELAVKHFNLTSQLDDILRQQTFPLLTINTDVISGVEIAISTNNALKYGKGFERPGFIAPPPAPAEILQNRIQRIEDKIKDITYNIETNRSQESGIALELKFQGLNSSLSKFANKLEDFEIRMWEMAFKYIKLVSPVKVNYEKDFSISDPLKEIEVLKEVDLLTDSPTYKKQKTLQILKNTLSSVTQESWAEIEREVTESIKVEKE
ncbi:MAG: hypothetical protein C6I01_01830 [Epsilonproteobacteria bacterium]|nr:hypothetical protein [Campylobacterota bacterium]